MDLQIRKMGCIMDKNVLAIIPARGSNDELEHMNIRELGNHPLIYYTIKAALGSKKIDRVIVSTEDNTVSDISVSLGAEVPFMRPDYLCNGDTTLIDVAKYVLDKLYTTEGSAYDIVVVLLPNTPFKTSQDIDNMIEYLIINNVNSVIPFCQVKEFLWEIDGNKIIPVNFDDRKRRQDVKYICEEKGGIYVYKKEIFEYDLDKLRLGHKKGYYLINEHNAQTIHTTYDFFIFERLIRLPTNLINLIMKSE